MKELNLATLLGVAAALLHATAYILYNRQARQKKSVPNPVSWFVWMIVAVLNALTYKAMNDSFVLALQFIVGTFGSVITFFHVISIGKISKLEKSEYWTLVLAFIAGAIWWIFQSATCANLILALALLIGTWPTFRGVLDDPTKETSTPWIIWCCAFIVTFLNVAIQKGWTWALITPALFGIVEGSIAFLSRESRKNYHFGYLP